MYTEDFYTNYFKSLAESLSDLSHTDAKPSFLVNNETGDGPTEIKKELNGKLRTPCLVLEEEELDSDGSSPGQKQMITGGFSILQRFDPNNAASLRTARKTAKVIARKIVNKMKRDSRASFGEDSPILQANAVQLAEIKQYPTPIVLNILIGWSVEFQWIQPDDIRFGMEDFQ